MSERTNLHTVLSIIPILFLFTKSSQSRFQALYSSAKNEGQYYSTTVVSMSQTLRTGREHDYMNALRPIDGMTSLFSILKGYGSMEVHQYFFFLILTEAR